MFWEQGTVHIKYICMDGESSRLTSFAVVRLLLCVDWKTVSLKFMRRLHAWFYDAGRLEIMSSDDDNDRKNCTHTYH